MSKRADLINEDTPPYLTDFRAGIKPSIAELAWDAAPRQVLLGSQTVISVMPRLFQA